MEEKKKSLLFQSLFIMGEKNEKSLMILKNLFYPEMSAIKMTLKVFLRICSILVINF